MLSRNAGVIQGAVLPPFFSALITDLMRSQFNKITVVKFVDDIFVVARTGNLDEMNNYLQMVKDVCHWSKEHSHIVSATKVVN